MNSLEYESTQVRSLLEVSQLTNVLKSRIEDPSLSEVKEERKENLPRVTRKLNEKWTKMRQRLRDTRRRILKHENRVPKLVERNRRVSRLRFHDPYVRQREIRKAFQERFDALKLSLTRSKNVTRSLLFRMMRVENESDTEIERGTGKTTTTFDKIKGALKLRVSNDETKSIIERDDIKLNKLSVLRSSKSETEGLQKGFVEFHPAKSKRIHKPFKK